MYVLDAELLATVLTVEPIKPLIISVAVACLVFTSETEFFIHLVSPSDTALPKDESLQQ